jgi:hypothetical protein
MFFKKSEAILFKDAQPLSRHGFPIYRKERNCVMRVNFLSPGKNLRTLKSIS